MTNEPRRPPAPLHPANHWGPFATDPWSPDLDPVTGPAWERAARAGRVGVDPTIDPARSTVVPDSFPEPG
jgi:hypothetical protein